MCKNYFLVALAVSTINSEAKRTQGRGQGQTSLRQDEGDDDDGRPVADDES